jgi:ribonuclease D
LISRQQELDALLDEATCQEAVALDTEFVWTSTYSPRLGLIQLGWSQDHAYLLDVPALGNLERLGDLLSDSGVCKILHDSQQDLTILKAATGALPRNVFDTRLTAGFIGLASTLSLANLLLELAEIELAKSETRTDWLKRPLSEKQVEYALDDIRFLPALREHILAEAEGNGNLVRLEEDLATLDREELYLPRKPESQFLRIKGAGRLKPKSLTVLRALAAWRESEAAARDIPRGHVLQDAVLLKIAGQDIHSLADLKRSRLLPQGARRRYEETLGAVLAEAQQVPEAEWPEPIDQNRPSAEEKARTSAFLVQLEAVAKPLGIDPALICSRREASACFKGEHAEYHGRLTNGWRRKMAEQALSELAQGCSE